MLHNPPPLRQLILGRFGWWNLWLLCDAGRVRSAIGAGQPRECGTGDRAGGVHPGRGGRDRPAEVPAQSGRCLRRREAASGPGRAHHNDMPEGKEEQDVKAGIDWLWGRTVAAGARRRRAGCAGRSELAAGTAGPTDTPVSTFRRRESLYPLDIPPAGLHYPASMPMVAQITPFSAGTLLLILGALGLYVASRAAADALARRGRDAAAFAGADGAGALDADRARGVARGGGGAGGPGAGRAVRHDGRGGVAGAGDHHLPVAARVAAALAGGRGRSSWPRRCSSSSRASARA